MNPARWAGLGKLLGLWPGDGDGLVYNNKGLAQRSRYSHWAKPSLLYTSSLRSLC